MLNRRTDRIADAVHLLAAVAAAAADPTLMSALKSGPGAYDALKKLAASPPPGVARLGEVLGAEARALFDATRDLPTDAEALFPQMVEAGLVAAPDIVAAGMDPGTVTEAMLARMTAPEHRTAPMVGLFRALTVPALTRMLADNAFADDLRAAFMAEVLRRLGDLGGRLESVDRLTRLEMTALGDRFEIAGMHALSDAGLREALEKKAEEYRAYRALIEAIDERTAGLGNLKAAAREAAERLDFDEVETLLARVDEVETETAAETKLLRADNALLRGRVEEAFVLLTAAADGFGSVAPLEPARRRLRYVGRLRDHGRRYGGPGIACAERMIRMALCDLAEEREPGLWAAGQVSLGITLWEQGTRLGGGAGAGLLGEAVEAYCAALRVLTEAADPVDWGKTQNSLGNALLEQGERLAEAGAGLLDAAVQAYRAALRVRTEAAHPADWAATQTNLGSALQSQAERVGGEAGAGLRGEAVEAYRAALRVRTEATHSVGWADTQNNLGNALWAHGAQVGGEAGARVLNDAVEAYRAALRVRTEAAYPVDWAITQNNLGTALVTQGERVGGEAGAGLLGEAVAAYRAALRILTEAEHPVDWAMTQSNIGGALSEHGELIGGAAGVGLLGAAVEAYRAALRVRTETTHPVGWARTQTNLGVALQAHGARLGGAKGAALLDDSVNAFRAALRVRTEAAHPVDWAMTMENMALAQEALAENGTGVDPCTELREAAACFAAALRVYDPEHTPYYHQKASASLARVSEKLARDCA